MRGRWVLERSRRVGGDKCLNVVVVGRKAKLGKMATKYKSRSSTCDYMRKAAPESAVSLLQILEIAVADLNFSFYLLGLVLLRRRGRRGREVEVGSLNVANNNRRRKRRYDGAFC